jgi:chaperonin GroES
MQAIRNKVIFKAFYNEKTAGGLIVPDSHKERNSIGLVISVGSGTKDKPMQFKKDDIIYYIKNSGTEIEHNGEKYFVIDDHNILSKKINA